MKNRYLAYSVLLVFFSNFPINTCSAADDNSERKPLRQFLLQGQRSYAQKKVGEAVENFTRVLLLDPANKSAREHLTIINTQFPLPASQKVQLFLLEDLLVFLDNLQEKLAYFQAKRDALAAALNSSDYPAAFFEQKFLEIRNQFVLAEAKIPAEEIPEESLAALNEFLMRKKEKLSRELQATKAQFSWLRGNLNQRPLAAPAPIKIVVTPPAEVPVPVFPKAGAAAAQPEQQITGFRTELDEMRRQIKALQEDLRDKDERIEALTKQIVEYSLKLTEREMIFNEKIDVFGSLREAYENLESRLELSQKILEEKNGQIQSLQESLAALQADTAVHAQEIKILMAAKDKALEEWENILGIYQAKLKAASQKIDAGNNDMAALQEQLAAVRTKLFEKETALAKTKQKLASLEQQFQSVISGTNRP